jgi:DNA replication protein DnaC
LAMHNQSRRDTSRTCGVGKATVITSQLPVKAWHDSMQDPTLADAILDRLVHNAYKLELKGESMRRKRSSLDQKTETVTE